MGFKVPKSSSYAPHLQAVVRSPFLLSQVRDWPCTLRVAPLVGLRCAPNATVVAAHLSYLGGGMGIKESDVFHAAACSVCHDIFDRRHEAYRQLIAQRDAVLERVLIGMMETMSMHIEAGNINIKNASTVTFGPIYKMGGTI